MEISKLASNGPFFPESYTTRSREIRRGDRRFVDNTYAGFHRHDQTERIFSFADRDRNMSSIVLHSLPIELPLVCLLQRRDGDDRTSDV